MRTVCLKTIFWLMFFVFFFKSLMADDTFVAMGDFFHLAIPCFCLWQSFSRNDKEGMREFLCALLSMIILIRGLKWITNDMSIGIRPHGGKGSFPSWHTSSSFQGGFFLWRRCGWKWGLFTIGLASLTAYSRVYGQYHHWRDIIVGIIVAFFINQLFVTSYQKKKKSEKKLFFRTF